MTASRVDLFKQMLESDPENTTVLFGLANEYQKSERYDEVVATIKEYLQRSDDEGAAYGMLARAYEKIGDRAAARAAYERGISVAEAHHHPSMADDYRMTIEADYADGGEAV